MEIERHASLTKGRKLTTEELSRSVITGRKRKMVADGEGTPHGAAKKQKLESPGRKPATPKPIDFVTSDLEELQRELEAEKERALLSESEKVAQVSKPESTVVKSETVVTKATVKTRTSAGRRSSSASLQDVKTPAKSPRGASLKGAVPPVKSLRSASSLQGVVTPERSPRLSKRFKQELIPEAVKSQVNNVQGSVAKLENQLFTTQDKDSEAKETTLNTQDVPRHVEISTLLDSPTVLDKSTVLDSPTELKESTVLDSLTVLHKSTAGDQSTSAVNAQINNPVVVKVPELENSVAVSVDNKVLEVESETKLKNPPMNGQEACLPDVMPPQPAQQDVIAAVVKPPILDKREQVRAAASQALKAFMSRALHGSKAMAAVTPVSSLMLPADAKATPSTTRSTPAPVHPAAPISAVATPTFPHSSHLAAPISAVATPLLPHSSHSAAPSTAESSPAYLLASHSSFGALTPTDQPKSAKRLKKGWVMEVVFVPDVKVETEETKSATLERETRHRRPSKILLEENEEVNSPATKKPKAKTGVAKTPVFKPVVVGENEKLPASVEEIKPGKAVRGYVRQKPKVVKLSTILPASKQSSEILLNTTAEFDNSLSITSNDLTSLSNAESLDDSQLNGSPSGITVTPATPTGGRVIISPRRLTDTGISPKVRLMKMVGKAGVKNASTEAALLPTNLPSMLTSDSLAGRNGDNFTKSGHARPLKKMLKKNKNIVQDNQMSCILVMPPPGNGKSLLKDTSSSSGNVASLIKNSNKSSLKDGTGVNKGSLKDMSWVKKGSLKDMSWVIKGFSKDATGVSKSCLKDGSGVGNKTQTNDGSIVRTDGSFGDRPFVSMQDCGINVVNNPIGLMTR